MSNEQETVSVSIPAPPKGWKVDGYREAQPGEMRHFCGRWALWEDDYVSDFKYPCAIREQSEAEKPTPNELVRFWAHSENGSCVEAEDDTGGLWYSFCLPDQGDWEPDGKQDRDHELHPTTSIKRSINGQPVRVDVVEGVVKAGNCDEYGNYLPEEQPEPEYEEIPVVLESSFLIANGRSTTAWQSHADFAGAVYEHPNGHRKVFGFTHPIFVRPASQAAIWDWSHAETKQHTHMIRPVAIRRKVAK